ncbi:hypothetical protein [Acinetobacter pullicarnis]|uniref:hypothetical protein n=1 Tax=Acinetobacter pullicarnis TaxID=2576829 RepID=UPI00111EBBB6|nr:hypothetical protein [Acinetobacter pullicarnis]
MEELIKIIPANLPAWVYVLIIIVIVIGLIGIAKITGNSQKKVNKYSNISQSGIGNIQQIGEKIENKEEK